MLAILINHRIDDYSLFAKHKRSTIDKRLRKLCDSDNQIISYKIPQHRIFFTRKSHAH